MNQNVLNLNFVYGFIGIVKYILHYVCYGEGRRVGNMLNDM